jgi:capsular exopolysaccharide synthesis family protein
MTTGDIYQKGLQGRPVEHDDGLNLLKIFLLVLSKWYFFVIAVIIAFLCARFYIGHTQQIYSVSAKILINENKETQGPSNQMLQGFGLPIGTQNLDNQISILSSRTLIERALNELPFEIEYFYKTIKNRLPIYPEVPIDIIPKLEDNLPRDIEFLFVYLGGEKFHLKTVTRGASKIDKQYSFGDLIEYPDGDFVIEKNNPEWLARNKDRKMSFNIPTRMNLVKSYKRRLKVEAVSEEGTVVRITLEGTNRKKDADFLNKLAEVFTAISLDKKNLEAERRVQFINNQLVGISDSLLITENKLQSFRSRNRVMNISAQGEVIIDQAMNLENEKARIAIENNYYTYLAEYLSKGNTEEKPVSPATAGITDPGLARLVTELADLQNQLYSKSLGEKNPMQNQLILRIRNTREALMETLNGLIKANNMAMNENQEQIRRVNNQASTLPVTERQLLGIERQFKLNDELYTFLLEKRAELQIQRASYVPDNEMIDYANDLDSVVVSPNRPVIFLMAWFLGLAIPFFLILILNSLNKAIKEEDLKLITDIPVSGNIPHNSLKTNTVVFQDPETSISEAFRILRSRMQFFTKETKSPVILVTSSMPDDGKTFTAINLASVYSLTGKRTVLVGFDLRKPKIYGDFNIDNDRGVSSFLIGKDTLKDVIQKTDYENLFIIPSGPIPPNPSELTSLEKTEELLNQLRRNFDHIIIDSSPIGMVSDTFHLASLADTCLLVVRQGKTIRDLFEKTLKEIKISEVKGVSIVINDLPTDSKRYGYGGRYGYTKQENHKKNGIQKIKHLAKLKSA